MIKFCGTFFNCADEATDMTTACSVQVCCVILFALTSVVNTQSPG